MNEGGWTCCTIHVHHLLPLSNSSFRGLNALTPSDAPHAWPIHPVKPRVRGRERWFWPVIGATLNALISACANSAQGTCETGNWWNEKKKKGCKHKQQETSTAITTINKENTKVRAERCYYIKSQGQHIKYIWCGNRYDLCLELIAKAKMFWYLFLVSLTKSLKIIHF